MSGVINGSKNSRPDIGAQMAEVVKEHTLLKGLELCRLTIFFNGCHSLFAC